MTTHGDRHDRFADAHPDANADRVRRWRRENPDLDRLSRKTQMLRRKAAMIVALAHPEEFAEEIRRQAEGTD